MARSRHLRWATLSLQKVEGARTYKGMVNHALDYGLNATFGFLAAIGDGLESNPKRRCGDCLVMSISVRILLDEMRRNCTETVKYYISPSLALSAPLFYVDRTAAGTGRVMSGAYELSIKRPWCAALLVGESWMRDTGIRKDAMLKAAREKGAMTSLCRSTTRRRPGSSIFQRRGGRSCSSAAMADGYTALEGVWREGVGVYLPALTASQLGHLTGAVWEVTTMQGNQ
ncbi:hypothetical protein EDD17DRAFT_1513329 [Pisolithus thermaeus]|nr:hypothetical protein EV401DRAFT_1890495 [Pisolithus croceorrhizus]KAI6151473.1 hypothetical protein EDD17DRAFT_1513329 [Pisolithus thermaeus]